MKMLISLIIILFFFFSFFCSDLKIEILVIKKEEGNTCFKTISDLLMNSRYICDIDML